MEILGGRKYIKLAGETVHELPPLLVHSKPVRRIDGVFGQAKKVVGEDGLLLPFLGEMVGEEERGRREENMAINVLTQYLGILHHWLWGQDVMEWIRQCEETFERQPNLRKLLCPDIWPHPSRTRFVTLLRDKAVPDEEGVDLEKAVGLRLVFRRRPRLDVFSDQFLFYLDSTLASTTYNTWAKMWSEGVGDFPPERFEVNVLKM